MSYSSERGPVRVVTIGHGGWTIYYDRRSRLQGYGDDWQEYVAQHAADEGAVIIDKTTAPYDALAELSIYGPMLDIDLPDGMVSQVFTSQPVPFAPDRRRGFLGNAESMDRVALDVYCAMAAYIGAAIQIAYRAGVGRPTVPPRRLPRRRHRADDWEPPSVRRLRRQPPPVHNATQAPSVLADLLPDGWQTDGYGDFDALLICPCGYAIEQDGTCPDGCVSPLREQGLI